MFLKYPVAWLTRWLNCAAKVKRQVSVTSTWVKRPVHDSRLQRTGHMHHRLGWLKHPQQKGRRVHTVQSLGVCGFPHGQKIHSFSSAGDVVTHSPLYTEGEPPHHHFWNTESWRHAWEPMTCAPKQNKGEQCSFEARKTISHKAGCVGSYLW